MEPNPARPDWLVPLTWGTHACFFYTTSSEFFSISTPFLSEVLGSLKERCLWILPPKYSFQKAREEAEKNLGLDLEPYLRLRRLIMLPWDKWYGSEISIQELLRRSKKMLKETLKEGYEGLKILSHSPSKTSHYWKDFLLFEETFTKSISPKAFVTLCGYSLIDCPAAVISPVATQHRLCLIHHGSGWEWLTNKAADSPRIPASNLLHSGPFHYRQSR